mgnify:CR=1 FL=1
MMILWFVIIGALVYFLIKGDFDFGSFQGRSADNHLDERLAKGEISIEEYQEINTDFSETLKSLNSDKMISLKKNSLGPWEYHFLK